MEGRSVESVLLGVQTVTVGGAGRVSLLYTADMTGLPIFDSITATALVISGQSPVALVFGS
jgi:hypothetical protein